MWINYKQEYFHWSWENTNSVQTEVESVKMYFTTDVVKNMCGSETGLVEQFTKLVKMLGV